MTADKLRGEGECGNCGNHTNDWPPAHVREAAQGEIDQLKKDLINADYDAERYRLGGLEWHDSWEEERRRVEAAERRLAELEKEYEHALSCMDRNCKQCGAALASLRAGSKEPVD